MRPKVNMTNWNWYSPYSPNPFLLYLYRPDPTRISTGPISQLQLLRCDFRSISHTLDSMILVVAIRRAADP